MLISRHNALELRSWMVDMAQAEVCSAINNASGTRNKISRTICRRILETLSEGGHQEINC